MSDRAGEPAEPDHRAEPGEGGTEGPAEDAPRPPVGWLPRSADALFGTGATAEEAYGLLTVDVPADRWLPALEVARDTLGCRYFDWLSAVDEPGEGYRICAHLVVVPAGRPAAAGAARADRSEPVGSEPAGSTASDVPRTGPGSVRRLLLRTTVPHDRPELPTATGVYAGAAWHERETHEMFGVDFPGHPHLVPLLLPDSFEGHPLRKEFVLAARVAKSWPGAKEPGESDAAPGGARRRQMLPPGVPDPNEWGPLKGQLPPAPARGRAAGGARPSRRAAGAGTDRPRRNRSASQGSASQRATDSGSATDSGPDAEARPATEAGRASDAERVTERPTGIERPTGTGRAGGRTAADQPWSRDRAAQTGSATPPTPESPDTAESPEDSGPAEPRPGGEER